MEAGSNRRVVLVQIEELSLRITESLYLCIVTAKTCVCVCCPLRTFNGKQKKRGRREHFGHWGS